MPRVNSPVAIDIVERAYDLEPDNHRWVETIDSSVRPLLDQGRGVVLSLWMGSDGHGIPFVNQVLCRSPELAQRYGGLVVKTSPQLLFETCLDAGCVNVMSETRPRWPHLYDLLSEHLECRDVLSFFAVDPDLCGVILSAPSDRIIRLSPAKKLLFQRLAVHLTAGARLRRPQGENPEFGSMRATDFPHNAEALLDPKRFRIEDAVGNATSASHRATIRQAAIRLDRARGRLRTSDPDEALHVWKGLVRGRWSLVDWFDTDGRRFVLAKPNPPELGDPRGLSEREHQVATYAARGESSKLIAYRFGISTQRVSALLQSAMRKLGAKTQAQLVEKMRAMPSSPETEKVASTRNEEG